MNLDQDAVLLTVRNDDDDPMDERMSNFSVGANYKVLDVIGEGAYGIVW